MKNICKSQNIKITDHTGGYTRTLIHKTEPETKSTTKQWKYAKYGGETAVQLW